MTIIVVVLSTWNLTRKRKCLKLWFDNNLVDLIITPKTDRWVRLQLRALLFFVVVRILLDACCWISLKSHRLWCLLLLAIFLTQTLQRLVQFIINCLRTENIMLVAYSNLVRGVFWRRPFRRIELNWLWLEMGGYLAAMTVISELCVDSVGIHTEKRLIRRWSIQLLTMSTTLLFLSVSASGSRWLKSFYKPRTCLLSDWTNKNLLNFTLIGATSISVAPILIIMGCWLWPEALRWLLLSASYSLHNVIVIHSLLKWFFLMNIWVRAEIDQSLLSFLLNCRFDFFAHEIRSHTSSQHPLQLYAVSDMLLDADSFNFSVLYFVVL